MSLLTANKSCTLPSICKSAGVIKSRAKKPSLMLCLRCGVTIDCSQAQLEGSVDQKQLVVEWETATTRVKEKASKKRREIKNSNRRYSQRCHHTWEVSNMGLAVPLPTAANIKETARERPSRSARAGRHPSSVDTHRDISLERKTKSLTAFQSRNVSEDRYSTPPHTKSQPNIRIKLRPLICKTSVKVVEQVSAYTHQNRKSPAKENPAETVSRYTRESPKIVVDMSKMKKDNVSPQAISCERSATQESLSPINVSQRVFKAKPDTCFNDSKLRYTQKVSVTSHKPRPSISPHQRSPKQQVPLRQQAPLRQQTPQTTLTARHMDKDKPRAVDPLVAGWNLPTFGQATEDEQDLMEKRTWSQPVIPPPFPTNPLPPKNSQKLLKNLQLSKTLAQHKRNLNQISKSYVSPYWAKKEVKNARNRSPASDSGDDRSSLSRITTISGMSSSSSESNTEGESSTDESHSDSGSSTSGSDFFTRYANKGGPTSVDDIFKRTLPRQKLQYSLNRIKEEKEKAEREQLGYLRGGEGATPPPRDHGDNVKDVERGVTFSVSEYDMCSDAEEIKELWKLCFPEVDFWDRKRRKQFKKTKILS